MRGGQYLGSPCWSRASSACWPRQTPVTWSHGSLLLSGTHSRNPTCSKICFHILYMCVYIYIYILNTESPFAKVCARRRICQMFRLDEFVRSWVVCSSAHWKIADQMSCNIARGNSLQVGDYSSESIPLSSSVFCRFHCHQRKHIRALHCSLAWC